MELVQRMKCEQGRSGRLGGKGRQMRVERKENFGEKGDWREFGCYVLVESFVLKRMYGSLLMPYDLLHSHQIKCKWDKSPVLLCLRSNQEVIAFVNFVLRTYP